MNIFFVVCVGDTCCVVVTRCLIIKIHWEMWRESEGGHQLGKSIGCRDDKVLHGCSLVSLGRNVIHSLLYGMKGYMY